MNEAVTTASTVPAKPPGPFSVLFNRDFRLLWVAGLFRFHSRWMELIVLGWIILEVTNSPFLVGTIGFFRMAAMPILGLPAGVMADRLNRKLIIVLTEGINAVFSIILFILVASGSIQFWQIAALTLTMGTSWMCSFPSRTSLVQDLVGSNRLTNAMSLDMSAMTASKMLGPILAGLLLYLAGPAAATFTLAALYTIGFLLLIPVRAPQRVVTMQREPVKQLLSEGVRFVVKSPVLLAAILITIAANMFIFPFMVMIPVFARDVLQVNETLMGILAAADGLGALVGALFLASRRSIRGPGMIYAFGTAFAAVAVLAFAQSTSYGLSLSLLLASGLAFAGFTVMQPVLMMLGAPPEMRGRSMGVNMVAVGSAPIGFLLTGAMSQAWGAPTAVTINCIAGLVCILGVIAFFPSVRRKTTFPEQEEITFTATSVAPPPTPGVGRSS